MSRSNPSLLARSVLAAAALVGVVVGTAAPAEAAASRVRWGVLDMEVSIEGPFRCTNLRHSGLTFANAYRGERNRRVFVRRWSCTRGDQRIDALQHLSVDFFGDDGWAQAIHWWDVTYNTSPSRLLDCGRAVTIWSTLSQYVDGSPRQGYGHPPRTSGAARCSNGTSIEVTAKVTEHLSVWA